MNRQQRMAIDRESGGGLLFHSMSKDKEHEEEKSS